MVCSGFHAMIRAINQPKGSTMESLIIITDPNKDPDDVISFVMAGYLQKRQLIDIKAIITTSGDFKARKQRALCTKGAFLSLGLDISIGIGSDYPFETKEKREYGNAIIETGKSLTTFVRQAKNAIQKDGNSLLLQSIKDAPDESLTFLIIAGMRDFYLLLKNHPALVKQKTKKVAIMGGVHWDEEGHIQADTDVHNNATDIKGAQGVYEILEHLNIPTSIIHRDAVYKARIPNDFYAQLNDMPHFLGKYMHEVQKKYIESLFQDVLKRNASTGKTLAWFFEHFTDLPPDSLERNFDSVWAHTLYLSI